MPDTAGATALFTLATKLVRLFGARILEVAVRYGFSLALALGLGVAGAGQIYLGLSVIAFASALARFGLEAGMMRQLSIARLAGDAVAARGIAVFALAFVALLGTFLSTLLLLAAPALVTRAFGAAISEATLRAMAFSVLGLALLPMLASLLMALARPVLGQLLSAVLWPLPVMAWLLLARADAPSTAMFITLASLAVALVGGGVVTRRLEGWSPLRLPAVFPALRSALPLFGAELIQILLYHLPLLALGLIAGDADLGRFGLASRLSVLLTVMAMAMVAITGPRFARLHAQGDRQGLQSAALSATRMVAGAALPVALIFWLLPGPLLGLVGADFRPAAPDLAILALGHFVNVALSASNTLLVMTGHERDLWRNSVIAALVLLGALGLLLPVVGTLAPALASAAAYGAISLANIRSVRGRLGIDLLQAFRPQRR